MTTTTCTFDPLGSGVHSDDLVAVFHGEMLPLVVCGYHAAHWTPGEIRAGRLSGRGEADTRETS